MAMRFTFTGVTVQNSEEKDNLRHFGTEMEMILRRI
jgi:hypothetical protein